MLAAEFTIAFSVPLELFNVCSETREMELSNLGVANTETKGWKLGESIREISIVNG